MPHSENPSGSEPTDAAGSRPWHIALIASTVLILELALIRQIPAEVKAISYFTNLILMASFFGLGLGCILERRRSMAWALPAGLLAVFLFVLAGRGIVIYPGTGDIHFWIQDTEVEGRAAKLPIVPAAALAFLFVATPFVALGQALARAMGRWPRLTAYGWDIGGSLAGTAVFAAASALKVPPWVWPPILMAAWAAVFLKRPRQRLIWVAAGAVYLVFAHSPQAWSWSPYYFVQHQHEDGGTRVWVNSSFHQFCMDFTTETPTIRKGQARMLHKWNRPYDWYRKLNDGKPPRRVLILGAGTGNDVNVALVQGAEEITAVEIDPVILELGREHNATDPYADPRVRAVVDDGRHFLRTSDQRFDMIVFGTLDSQALLSGHANLRLENYVYTRESLLDAKRLLADGGMVAVYYSVLKPWLYGRIYTTVREAFGDHSRIFLERDQALFNTVIAGVRGREEFRNPPEIVDAFGNGIPSTDDWPFIYLEHPTIAPIYLWLLAVVAVLIGLAFWVLRRVTPKGGKRNISPKDSITGLNAHFLFLGVGFTLMESSAIVRLALIFGSTWTVNAAVFSSVLLMIFIANWTVIRGWAPPLAIAWPSLCASIVLNYYLPVAALFDLGPGLRLAASGLSIGLPVYFAAVCFSRLFRRQPVTGYALGVNLIGAMAGGFVEYVSMLIGLRQVWLVVLIVYLLAWLSTRLIERRPITPAPGPGSA